MNSAQRAAVHEIVHVATLNFNPNIGDNPRWLWESVPLYLAGEFVDPKKRSEFADRQCSSIEKLR